MVWYDIWLYWSNIVKVNIFLSWIIVLRGDLFELLRMQCQSEDTCGMCGPTQLVASHLIWLANRLNQLISFQKCNRAVLLYSNAHCCSVIFVQQTAGSVFLFIFVCCADGLVMKSIVVGDLFRKTGLCLSYWSFILRLQACILQRMEWKTSCITVLWQGFPIVLVSSIHRTENVITSNIHYAKSKIAFFFWQNNRLQQVK